MSTLRRLALLSLALLAACAGTAETARETDAGERPVTVEFRGNDSLADRELYREIEDAMITFGRQSTRLAIVFDAARDLEDLYRSLGFPDVRVQHEVVPAPELTVRFTVAEGLRVVVVSLALAGNTNLGDAELLELWSRTRSGLLGTGDPYFVEANLLAFRASIVARYRSDGYLDASVAAPTIEREPDSPIARVRIDIDEGARYVTTAVTVTPELTPPQPFDVAPAIGRPYDVVSVRALRIRLQRALEDSGYAEPDITTQAEVDRKRHEVRLSFRGDRGARKRVASIAIRGQDRTAESLIARKIRQREGDWYRGGQIEQSVQDLYATGLFRKVAVERTELGDDRLALDMIVEEAEARDLSFLVGYGSYEQARLGASVGDNNLFGLGQRARLGGKVSTRSLGTDLTWTEPELFHTRTGLTITGFAKERQEPSFTDTSNGVSSALSRRLFANTQGRVGYSFEARDARDVDPTVTLDSQQRFRIGQVFGELVYDDRDSPLFPTEGQRHLLRFEHADEALGGQVALNRLVASFTWHVPLPWEDWVLGLAARTGLVWSLQEQELPVQERFFNGGNDSVRSFREAQLGPRSAGGFPIGGEYRNILSAELRFPLFGALQGAVFGDAGNVGLDVDGYGLGNLRYAIGAGLRLGLCRRN